MDERRTRGHQRDGSGGEAAGEMASCHSRTSAERRRFRFNSFIGWGYFGWLLVVGLMGHMLEAARVPSKGRYRVGASRDLLNFTETSASFNTHDEFACTDCLRGRTLRVMYFDVEYVVQNPAARDRASALGIPYDYLCDDPARAIPECFDFRNWNSGWVGELGYEIFEHLGVDVIALTRANFSDEVYEVYQGASSYSRCVYEVNLGNVDLCMGNFWETNARRPICPFTSPFELDAMVLLTMPDADEQASFRGKDLLGIFNPYDERVWAVTASFFVLMALVIYIIQGGQGHHDFEHEDSISDGGMRVLQGFLKSLWLTLMGYVTQAPQHNDSGWASRLALLGYAFMLYITISSYTANLASFMIIRFDVIGMISSFSDIKAVPDNKLCFLEALDTGILGVPEENKLLFDDYGPMLEKMYDGGCAGSVIGKMEYQTYIKSEFNVFYVCKDENDPFNHGSCQDENIESELIELRCTCKSDTTLDPFLCPEECPDYRKYCKVLEVKDSEFYKAVALAWPINGDILDYFSAWIVQLRLEGKVERYYNLYITSNFPDVCSQEIDLEATPLTIQSMAGTYVISVGIMLSGLMLNFVYKLLPSGQSEQADTSEVIPGEGVSGIASPGQAIGAGKLSPISATTARKHGHAQELVDDISHKMDAMLSRLEVLEAEAAERREKDLNRASQNSGFAPSAMDRVATVTRDTLNKAFDFTS